MKLGLRARPFKVMSLGLGRGYVDKNKDQLLEQLGVTVHGTQVGLPRYYAKRIGAKDRWLERPVVSDQAPSKVRRVWTGALRQDMLAVDDPRRQRELDAFAKTHLSKKEGV
jgi:hypothetical protein